MEDTALRNTWKNEPIESPKRIQIAMRFTERQFLKLTKGLIPEQMEDKWFIFYENEWLYFHRSWTGFGMYKAKLIKEQDGYSINEFWAERKQEKYKNEDDNLDIESFSFLLARGLLGIDVRADFERKNIQSDTDAIKQWSMFGQLLFTNKAVDYTHQVRSVLFGVAVGDALGVPVEFKGRELIRQKPVVDMVGYGTHSQPAGTWSDDSSLTFCLAEALTKDFDLNIISQSFVKWRDKDYWTATGKVFDVGNATQQAIDLLNQGVKPDLAGGVAVSSNGNGSLMRISPLLFYLFDKPIEKRYEITKQVSSITHGHIRSVIACFYYLEFARQLLEGKDKLVVYKNLQIEITSYLNCLLINQSEVALFDRLLKGNIQEVKEDKIFSSGYVLHTLEASIWCLLTTDSYKDAVLKAVNLGEDTDTTGAVTGGLAGLLYGYEDIPKKWVNGIARHDDIQDLATRLGKSLESANLQLYQR